MALQHYGSVDSEDGLLLLGDAATLRAWQGIAEESTPLARIEASLDTELEGCEVSIVEETGVIWNLEGPGTTDIFGDEALGTILLVRSWLEDTEDDHQTIQAFSVAPVSLTSPFAELRIASGFMVIIAPTESGDCIRHPSPSLYSLALSEMMTESSGLILPVAKGSYQCFADSVVREAGEARRCHLVRMS